MRTAGTERRNGLALAVVMITGMAAAKLAYSPALGANSLDGNFYLQIARHVAEGDGFVTSVSLYHQGLRTLPRMATVYPLWPVLLGQSARPLGLERAAEVVPETLYLLDLVLIYLLGSRLSRRFRDRQGEAPTVAMLNAGHAAVALLGTNPLFFRFTSLPYTEALAFALTLGALLALDNAQGIRDGKGRNLLLWCGIAGSLAAAGYLTRFQMLPLAFALALTLLLSARSRLTVAASVLILAIGAVAVALEGIYLHSCASPFRLTMLLDFASYRETPQLQPFSYLVRSPSIWEFIRDRAAGLLTAFNPRSENSYAASFGGGAYLPLLAGVAAVWPHGWLLSRLRNAPKAASLLLGVFLAGLALLAPVHATHATFFKPWLFGWRHGLPFILVILASLGVLLVHPKRLLRAATACVVTVVVAANCLALAHELSSPQPGGPSTGETALVAWLESAAVPPTILTTKAQQLSLWTRALIHWSYCADDPNQTVTLLNDLPIDYLILYPGEEHCPFVSSLESRLTEVARFGDNAGSITVLRWQK